MDLGNEINEIWREAKSTAPLQFYKNSEAYNADQNHLKEKNQVLFLPKDPLKYLSNVNPL